MKQNLIIHVVRAVVGWFIIYIGLSIVLLDPASALGIIAISVICTAGISLILWIPISYLVGWGALSLISLLKKLFTGDTPPKDEQETAAQQGNLSTLSERLNQELRGGSPLTTDQQALTHYIAKASAKGLTNDQIRANLENNGWSIGNINWAFTHLSGEGQA